MDSFFFVKMPDGTKQRLNRSDKRPVLMPSLLAFADIAQELLRLPVGGKVALGQVGTVQSGASFVLPDIKSNDESVVKITRTLHRGGHEQAFEILATGAGFAWLFGSVGGNPTDLPPIGVAVGKIENHPDMTIDFIADAFRGGDVVKIVRLQRLLDNNFNNQFNENSDANVEQWGELACGTVAKVGGLKLFSDKTDYDYHRYHTLLRQVTDRRDVTYPPGVIAKAAIAIQAKLKKGVPVLVGVVYNPSTAMLSGGELEVTRGGGHTVLIVGCDAGAKKFLYIDPYPKASHLVYGGGIATFPFEETCEFLGTFEIGDLYERKGILRQSPGSVGDLSELEIVSGPKV